MALTPAEQAAAKKILAGLGRTNWTVQGTREETAEVQTKDQYGEVTGKEQKPTGNVVWIIVGPSGQPDEIVVKQSKPGTPAGGGGSTDAPSPAAEPTFELVNGPKNPIAKGSADDPQGVTQANDPKGSRKTTIIAMPDGSKASIEEVADGLGNWSPDVSKPPTPYIAAKGEAPPAPVASTTLKQIPVLKDGVWGWEDNRNYVAPKEDKPPTAGEAAQDAALARNAGAASDVALSASQAEVETRQIALANAQRLLRQSPTDEQAQLAVSTAQKGLELANKGLEQAQGITAQEAPGRLAQQGATLASTQAGTATSAENIKKGQQGDLYGLEDKIKQIRDLIASGEVKPQDGDSMIVAARQGTNVYDVMKQQAAEKSTARGQDSSAKASLGSTFGSTFNNSLSQFGEMNKTGAVGSDATGKAFLATLGLAQDYLKSYEMPAASPTDYLGTGSPVGAMANMAQQQIAAQPVPPPVIAPPPSAATPVTINIGSGAASNPQPQAVPPPVALGGVPNPLASGGMGPVGSSDAALQSGGQLAGAASRGTPAGMGDIAAAFPGAAKRHGLMQ